MQRLEDRRVDGTVCVRIEVMMMMVEKLMSEAQKRVVDGRVRVVGGRVQIEERDAAREGAPRDTLDRNEVTADGDGMEGVVDCVQSTRRLDPNER